MFYLAIGLVIAQVVIDLLIMNQLGYFKLPKKTKLVTNSGREYRICQFCKRNLPEVITTKDGYSACTKCRLLVLKEPA